MQAGSRGERIVRRDEGLRHRGRLDPVKCIGNARKITLRHYDKLCLRATRSEPENAITGFPRAHRVTDRLHFTGEFKTGDILRITGRRRIIPSTLENIRAVQPCCVDTDTNAINLLALILTVHP